MDAKTAVEVDLSKIGREELLCPSAECKPGNSLFAYVQENRLIARLPVPVEIDARFVEDASTHPKSPRQRFRFAGKCGTNTCRNWSDGKCGIANIIVSAGREVGLEAARRLPKCLIRPECRWFHEHGAAACVACDYVITEIVP